MVRRSYLLAEAPGYNGGRSMRAVKDSLAFPLRAKWGKADISWVGRTMICWIRAVKIAIIKIRRRAGSRYSSSVKPEVV